MGVSMPMRECIECASGGVRQVRRRQEEIAGGTRGDGQACPGWVRTQEGGHVDEKVQPRFAMIQVQRFDGLARAIFESWQNAFVVQPGSL